MASIDDVRVLFPRELEELLLFSETENYIVIKPRKFLKSSDFVKVSAIVRDAGGEYVSAGRDSHFKIKREAPSQNVVQDVKMARDALLDWMIDETQKKIDSLEQLKQRLLKQRER